jgi:probable rRNA maturation factor
MNKFEIINETTEEIKEIDEINKLLKFALKNQNIDNAIFNVIIVDQETIKEINKTYRGKDSITDVISFALEDDKTFIKTDFRILGDIYICLNKAKMQAEEYGHSFLRELSFLTIHGLLHLLGYDHIEKEDEEVMFKLQEMILDEYGIKKDN